MLTMASVTSDARTIAHARLPTVYIDESGNTGEHLTDSAQPVFVLAGVHLSDDDGARLASGVASGAGEAHYTTLRKRRRGQDKVLALLADPTLREKETVRVSALLKPFMVIPKLVDLLIEPAMHEQGADL